VTTDELLEKATPRPWSLNSRGELVVRWDAAPGLYAVYTPDEDYDGAKFDMALMCRAVNSFEAARQALKLAAEAIESAQFSADAQMGQLSAADLEICYALKLMEGEA
jgi:hypothetical protein